MRLYKSVFLLSALACQWFHLEQNEIRWHCDVSRTALK